MTRDGRQLLEHFSFENVNSLADSIALKKNLMATVRLSLI